MYPFLIGLVVRQRDDGNKRLYWRRDAESSYSGDTSRALHVSDVWAPSRHIRARTHLPHIRTPFFYHWLANTFTFHFHALEKEMATHSSVLAWRIPGTGEPGGLPSMGLHRGGHDWSDLAAANTEGWPVSLDVARVFKKTISLTWTHFMSWFCLAV